MTTLYDTIVQALNQHLDEPIQSRITNLALGLVSLINSGCCILGAMARAMPLDTKLDSKKQRLQRFLANTAITQKDHFQPIVKASLRGLKNQPVSLVIDQLVLSDKQNILAVGACFRSRTVPLVVKLLDHQGLSAFADHVEVLEQALNLLPEGVRVTVHGDSGFRSIALCDWLRKRGCHVMLNIACSTTVYTDATDEEGQSVEDLVGKREDVGYWNEVFVTTMRYGPVNLFAWWDKNKEGDAQIRAVMTDRPARKYTKEQGKKRMWIETMFGDWQSRGFQVQRTGVQKRERLERLLIIVMLGYLWMVSLGRWVVKRGYRTIIDDGDGKERRSSLFHLGKTWLQHRRSCEKPLKFLWYIYV